MFSEDFPCENQSHSVYCNRLFEVSGWGLPMGVTKLLCGNVILFRSVCPQCGEKCLAGTAQFECGGCKMKWVEREIAHKKRVSLSTCTPRHKPSFEGQRRILEEQNGKCYWCGRWFNSIVRRYSKVYHLKIHWDHKIPYVYNQNNADENFVAACNFYNCFKSDKIFPFDDDCRKYLKERWQQDIYDGTIEEMFEENPLDPLDLDEE